MKKKSSEKCFKITTCRVCDSKKLKTILDLGDQPLANNLEDSAYSGDKYPLKQVQCQKCKTVQLSHTVDKEVLFADYMYDSSHSKEFIKHFESLAETIVEKYGKKVDVLEVGANDGILIKPLRELGLRAIGIDPAERFCDNKTIFKAWIEDFEQQYHNKYDVIIGCNVFAHIHDINKAMANVVNLLRQEGTFIFEVQYLGKMVDGGLFDMVYHEHFFYWSIQSLAVMLEKHGLYIDEVEDIETHGGSIRVYAKRDIDLGMEDDIDMSDYQTRVREKLFALNSFFASQEHVIIYGAPAKATVLFNKLETSAVFAIDDNEIKQGKYIPGTGIIIEQSPNGTYWRNSDATVFIAAWNVADSIIKKVRRLGFKGNFVIPTNPPQLI